MVFIPKANTTCYAWKGFCVLFQIMPFQLQCMGEGLTTLLTDTFLMNFNMELQIFASGENLTTLLSLAFLALSLYQGPLLSVVLSFSIPIEKRC